MSERILVTGATGKVGREVIVRLLDRDRVVMAATRSPERAVDLLPPEADVVEFDYERPATWDAAVEWADRVFVVPPPFDPTAYRTLSSFLDWAVQAGSRHVVVLTAMGVELEEDLALRQVERLVEETGVRHTFLRPNVYMQNFHPGFIGRQIREEGAFTLPAGSARVSLVDARDVAAVAAEVLTSEVPPHHGRAYTLTGPSALDHDEIAAVLSQVSRREIEYRPGEDDEIAARLDDLGWPREQIEVVNRFFRTIREGGRSEVSGDVQAVLGRAPVSFASWAREHAGAWEAG